MKTQTLVLSFLVMTSCATSGADPYLWLEDIQGERSLNWVQERNSRDIPKLEAGALFESFKREALQILDSKERIAWPRTLGSWVYNFWQDEKNPRGVWRRVSKNEYLKPNPRWEIVVDVDSLARQENENWVWKGASCLAPRYERCMIHLSRGGKDATEVREFDLIRKEFVPDGFRLSEAKNRVDWIGPDLIFVGTDFGPDSMTDSGYPREVRIWKRGNPLSSSKRIFQAPKAYVSTGGTTIDRPEGQYRFVSASPNFFSEELYWMRDDDSLVRVGIPDDSSFYGVFQGQLLAKLRTAWSPAGREFPAGSLVSVPVEAIGTPRFDSSVQEVLIPDSRMSIGWVVDSSDAIWIGTLENVRGRVRRMTWSDSTWKSHPVSFEDHGSVWVIDSSPFSRDVFIRYESFLMPSTLFRAEGGGMPKKVKALPAYFDVSDLQVDQWEATSADGTRIPYFIIKKKSARLDGTNPTLLYGYGGFEVSQYPYYGAVMGKLWLERGGVYVVANIRGGGEFGPNWHQSALLENRQRAFDDFIAVGEDLISKKVTSPRHLGIMGGSNGGLLVGAVMVQRPELFNAVVCQVPLLDMLRYHRLLAGASWMAEYGDPDDPKMRPVLERYSPYQNVRPGVRYPEAFFFTSTQDDRVHPGHARKMVARMTEQGHSVYYYENTEGGHGGTTNNTQRARLSGMMYNYLFQKLGKTSGK